MLAYFQTNILLKTAIVYVHLLAAAFALVELLRFDIRFLRNLNRPFAVFDLQRLIVAKRTVRLALIVLWLTGIWMVVNGAIDEPGKYLANQKLWMKLFTVLLLTLNGMLMHSIGFSHFLEAGTVFTQLAYKSQLRLLGMGVVSSVSWLYAAFLGIARPWNYTTEFQDLFSIYIWLLLCGFIVTNLLLLSRRLPKLRAQLAELHRLSAPTKLALFAGFSTASRREFLSLADWHRLQSKRIFRRVNSIILSMRRAKQMLKRTGSR